jgi:hypothetical protein
MNTAMIPIPNDIVKYTHPEESRFVFSKLYKSANYAPLLLMESSPGQVELSSIKLVFTPSPLSMQGFQSGPVPGTFTRLRSCIVPAEITEPPKISGGQNHKYDRLVEYFS